MTDPAGGPGRWSSAVVVIWLMAIATGGRPLTAQSPTLFDELTLTGGSTFAEPFLSFDVAGLPWLARGRLSADRGRRWHSGIDLSTAQSLPSPPGFSSDYQASIVFHATGFTGGLGPTTPDWGFGSSARIRLDGPGFGLWVDGTGARYHHATRSTPEGRLGAGLWLGSAKLRVRASLRRAEYEEMVTLGEDRVFTVGGFNFVSRRSRILPLPRAHVDGELAIDYYTGRWSLVGSGGIRDPDVAGPRAFASLGLGTELGQGISLALRGGYHPGSPAIGLPRGRFVSAGLSVSLQAYSRRSRNEVGGHLVSLSTSRAGIVRLALTGVEAGSVELRGDLTNWNPVPMRRASDGTWSVDVPADPGVYGVTVRIDRGPWMPAPGLPRVEDGFGGLVGMLEIPELEFPR